MVELYLKIKALSFFMGLLIPGVVVICLVLSVALSSVASHFNSRR